MARIFRVFSLAGAALGVVELYLEATWTRRLYESGEFELTAPVTPETLELLKPGNIVVRDPDDGDAGIIETLNMEWGDDGQMITAGGRMLAALLGRRVILDDTATEGDAESVMLALIANNCCAAGDRKIPGMSVPASQYRGEKVTVEAYGKNLLDKVQEIAEDNDLGFRVCWPSLAVEIVQGVDRTAGQSTNVRAIFSVSAETLNQMEYEHDDTDAANVCIVRYEPKETSAEVRTVGTQTGIERKEIFTTLKEADATTTVTVGEGGNGIITTTDWDASMDTAGALALAKSGPWHVRGTSRPPQPPICEQVRAEAEPESGPGARPRATSPIGTLS